MYITCGFVPATLACDDSLKMQINALLSHVVPDVSGPVLCANSVAALNARLQELPSEGLWSQAGAELTTQVLGVLSSVRLRLLTAADVQEKCNTTTLNLLRRRGDVLGLQLCVGTTGCAVQALEQNVSKQVSDAVLACSKVWTGSSSFGLQELQLLALTQKLPKVIRTVTSGVIPGISDDNAYEQILYDSTSVSCGASFAVSRGATTHGTSPR